MDVSEILSAERVLCGLEAKSKKRALEIMGELLVRDSLPVPHQEVFNCLISRERLGSTGLGHGVAIPHARVPRISSAVGAFIQLAEGVDYDAPDGEPVDLIFGLLVPEESNEEHLQILSKLAETFSDGALRARLRSCGTNAEIVELLTQPVSQT